MRSIMKFLLMLITFALSVFIIFVTISVFLNKFGLLDINEKIVDIPILNKFVVQETYEKTVKDTIQDYENNISKKDETIQQQETTISQLEDKVNKLLQEYKKLENELVEDNSKENSADIVSHYNSMKEKKVAEIFNNMDNKDIINILVDMDSEKIPKILEYMDVNKVSEITKILINLQS